MADWTRDRNDRYGWDRDRDRDFGRGPRDFETPYSGPGGYDAPRPSYRGRGPKNFQRSDERLRELVSEQLEEHHDVDASDVEVTVSNGEVTLSGTVADRRMKRMAEDVAVTVGGVKDVHNNLTIDRGFFSRMADSVRDATHRGEDDR